MRAIVYTQYGPPEMLRLTELEKPVPMEDEILVRVRAASVNSLDYHTLRGKPVIGRIITGLPKPKNTRPGVDLAGEVEAVGSRVTRFQPGDEVFGASHGTFAEYVCTQGKLLALKPANLSFAQTAAVPVAAFTALQGQRDQGHLQAGQKVLVNGGSGGVGTFAVQIAKALGAEVTAVCSPRNVDMLRSLGADTVIDYTRQDFTRGRGRYDLLLDPVGNHSLAACRRVIGPTGSYVMVGGPLAHLLMGALLRRFVRQRLVFFIAQSNLEDLLRLKELIEAQKVAPVIDRSYPLSEAAEAVCYLGAGHARSKVFITI